MRLTERKNWGVHSREKMKRRKEPFLNKTMFVQVAEQGRQRLNIECGEGEGLNRDEIRRLSGLVRTSYVSEKSLYSMRSMSITSVFYTPIQ